VIFNTTSVSFHGNPRPVACPSGVARRSLAFYYYSNGRPEEERSNAHSTLYQTPGAPARAPGDRRRATRSRLRAIARRWLPPIVIDAAKRVRDRGRHP
jgi:hypothetical protein